jgi:regulator of protease activity HflC (stomatin/prohibitin superfamily)
MDAAFAWLGHLAEWFGMFIPRIKIVRSTHAGVRFRHGKTPREIKPGIIVYWPIVTEVDIIPVARQTHNLPSQSLLTKDGKTVVVGGVVVYSIIDIVACMSRNWDITETINDITMVAIAKVITSHSLQYLQENLTGDILLQLTRETRRRLRPFGVKVYKTALTDFSTCMVIKNIGGGRGTILSGNQE